MLDEHGEQRQRIEVRALLGSFRPRWQTFDGLIEFAPRPPLITVVLGEDDWPGGDVIHQRGQIVTQAPCSTPCHGVLGTTVTVQVQRQRVQRSETQRPHQP
jgi:hypothetical protein